MGFVKTPQEIEEIQATLAEAHFLSAKLLTVQYLAKPDIVEMMDAYYTEADTTARCQALTRVSAEEFLPYAYNKFDDYAVVNNEAEEPWQPLRVA
jgi:hypothetical protein